MQFIFDNINAFLIGTVAFLIIVFMQFSSNEAVVDQASYYAAKSMLYAFSEAVEDDFTNIGLGVDPGDPIVIEHTATRFEFMRKINSTDPITSTVRYQLTPSDTVEVSGVPVPTFSLQRTVNGSNSGAGPPLITSFDVEMRDAAGAATTNEDDAESIYVFFEALSPFGTKKNYIKSIKWSRNFRSPNL